MHQEPSSWLHKAPEETDKAWATFQAYRDLPLASREKHLAAARVGVAKQSVTRWAKRYHWAQRIAEFDKAMDFARQANRADKIQDMQERHVALAQELQRKASVLMEEIDVDDVRFREVVSGISEGIKLERLANGQTTERIGQDDVNLEDLPTKDLMAIAKAGGLDPEGVVGK
jgi:hypothetical protein